MVRTINKFFEEIKKIYFIIEKRHKKWLVLLFFMALVSASLETLGVTIIPPVIYLMLEPEKIFEYEILLPLIEIFSIKNNNDMIIFLSMCVIFVFLIKNLYMVFFIWCRARISAMIQRQLSVKVLKSSINKGYNYFLNNNPSIIGQKINTDVMSFYTILNLLLNALVKIFIILLISIYMFYSDFTLAVGVVFTSIFCFFILSFGMKKTMKKVGIGLRESGIKANITLNQIIYGIKEILVMRKYDIFINRYDEDMGVRQENEIKRSVLSEIPTYIVEATFVMILMIIICIKMLMGNNSAEFMGVLASFAIGAFKILPAVSALSGTFGSIVSNQAGLDSLYETVNQDKVDMNKILYSDSKDKINNLTFSDKISLENISFRYSNSSDYVIKELFLDIQKNSSVALVGESGGGKSTLSDIILGIQPIEKGKVSIDGVNILDVPNYWGRIVGFVPQSIYLCDMSIAENVAFGLRNEEVDRSRVKEVLEMANILDFVESLEQGMDTVVGDRGMRLSGGQRQRIGIARALYYKPEILILDEATSALDNETEKTVMEAIETLKGKITLLIIAHRLTTIKNCDKIYEISNGKANERLYDQIKNNS